MVSFRSWVIKTQEFWWLHQAENLDIPLHDNSIKPFFIVSAGRSGTTLLRKKLLNSQDLHIPPESDDFIPGGALHFIRRNKDGWEKLIQDILAQFQQQAFSRYWNMDISRVGELLQNVPPENRSYAKLIDTLYRFAGSEDKPALRLWGDKTPYLIFRLEWLRRVFPGARYIHLFRDGRAVAHSMIKKQNYDPHKAAMRWKDSIRMFHIHRKIVKPEQILEIKYENFVRDPADTLTKIYGFLGLDFHESLLSDVNYDLGDDILPHHEGLHKPVTTASVDRWRRDMSAQEIRFLNSKLLHELKKLDYHI
jgi:hypothetical protein